MGLVARRCLSRTYGGEGLRSEDSQKRVVGNHDYDVHDLSTE